MKEKATGHNSYRRNNLDRSSSPYLLQHSDNPVWWQEWTRETTDMDMGSYLDYEYGGFGTGQKFPSHSILLFLLYFLSIKDDDELKMMITSSLDAMMLGGLNDHLQGGIFRYCVDRRWTIPHFEKMLYDQAMALWTYSLAYKVTGDEKVRGMAEKILKCLGECFEDNVLYITAFNADTEHEEATKYLWSREEIESLLESWEFIRFQDCLFIVVRSSHTFRSQSC